MNSRIHDIELIQSYLDRSLSGVEKENLEKRLKEEPQLNAMYQEQQQLVQGIRYAHLQHKLEQLRALEATLPKLDQKSSEGKQISLLHYWKPLAVAASISLIAMLLIWNRSEDSAKLYASYFEPYPNVFEPTVRSGSGKTDSRTEAFQAYDRGDYVQAAQLFKKLLKTNQEPALYLLLGNTNLMLDQVEEAKGNFLTLLKDFDELDLQAKWYLSLCYLKIGDEENARKVLTELGDTEILYATKAKELLRKVD